MDELPAFDPGCPMLGFLQIGDKWAAMIVVSLDGGPRRFTELKRALPAVSAKVLSETLRTMQRDGLVRRTSYPENPPHVQYQLTDLGRTLLPLIDAFGDWAAGHLDTLLRARQHYDSRAEPQVGRSS
jgi:DNA-binding HxlR family transcriptional regulator